jgi:diaminopimelate epimerase
VIPFVKANACGNDFLIIEEEFAGSDRAGIARKLCDRHFGIGADGVEWVDAHGETVDAILSNADGSIAEISGNGTRCVAAWLASQNQFEQVKVTTAVGEKLCRILSRTGNSFQVETDMGTPVLAPATVGNYSGMSVSIGNPHFVIFVDAFPNDWIDIGQQLSADAQFKEGCNVEFVRIAAPGAIEFRIYERGAGPTLSSGTGSCAAAVAAIAQHTMPRDLRVIAPGGEQRVRWQRELTLTGSAELVARGEAFL